MSDADFECIKYAASEVEKYEDALAAMLVNETVYKGNHVVAREAVALARKRFDALVAYIAAKTAHEAMVTVKKNGLRIDG